MSARAVVNCASTAPATQVPVSQSDLEKFALQQTALAAARAEETAREAALVAARPGATIRQKLKNGDALTAGELQTVVRWLALREARNLLD